LIHNDTQSDLTQGHNVLQSFEKVLSQYRELFALARQVKANNSNNPFPINDLQNDRIF
jgi:hypothetical protein